MKREYFQLLVVLLIGLGIVLIVQDLPVHAQSSHIRSFDALTMTSGNVQFASAGSCNKVQVYALKPDGTANAGPIAVGDSSISATRGVVLLSGAARELSLPGQQAQLALSTLYARGTAGDKLQFDCLN